MMIYLCEPNPARPGRHEGRLERFVCDRNRRDLTDRWRAPARHPVRHCEQGATKKPSVTRALALVCFVIIPLVNQVQSLKNRYGTITVISAKPCQNALGQFGTCMFMWDCIKSEGVHLGTCSDRFLFGSCCYHSSPIALTLPAAEPASQRLNATSPTNSSHNSSFVTLIGDESSQQYSPTTVTASSSAGLMHTGSPYKPDRLFLSSHSSSSSTPDYITPTTLVSSNSSIAGSDHVVNLSYDPPASQQYPHGNATRDQQSSNKIYAPSTITDWAMSVEPAQNAPVTTASAPTTTVAAATTSGASTTSTTTTPVPATLQQHSSEQTNWHQFQANYSTTPPPAQPEQSLVANTDGSTYSSAHQVLAYQTVPKPAVGYLSTLTGAGSTQESNNQTPRPGSSWLSRPSLLANAIFHSFKPYLNPNRQRPTYRPYMGGGFRPQHQPQRPLSVQHHRPLLFIPATLNSANQQPLSVPESPNSIQLGDAKVSPVSTGSGSSSSGQQENSDHHIVNPSTMTDRRRPIDQNNHPGSLTSGQIQSSNLMSQSATTSSTAMVMQDKDQQKQHSIAHYEMLNNHETVENFNNSIKISPNSTSPGGSSSNVQDSVYTLGGLQTNSTSVGYGDLSTSWQTPAPTTPAPQSTVVYVDYNSTHQAGYGGNNQPVASPPHQHVTNESVPGPSYPLISSNFISAAPVSDSGPIDEIHGLIDGGQHYEAHVKPQQQLQQPPPPVAPQQPSLLNSSLLAQLGNYQSSGAMNSFGTPSKNSSHADTSANQPSETTMIGNIDDPPRPSSSESSDGQTVGASSSNGPQVGVPAPPMPDVAPSSSTTTPSAPPARPPHQTHHQHHHHHHQHQVGPPLSGGGGGTNREATCGVTALYPQTKVVGGKNAAFGAWPWQVSVRKVSFFGFSSTHRCGGAVISSEWIATAGHCVEDLALQSIRIRVGEYDFSTMAEPYPHIERGARRKVVHPKYNFYTYENDLALVQLDQPLQFSPHVAPICLPPDNIDLVGRNATVTGWGRLNEGGTLPTILQEVIVPIVSNDKCRDMFLRAGRPEYIPDIFLCAGYEEGGRDSCQGDSGGPLQVRGDDGRWVLAGIISWGIGCAEPLLVGVCSAIQRFKPWIQSTISATG